MPRIRGNGGFVGKAAVANTIFQRGIWTLAEQELYALAGTWPGIFAYSVQVLYLIVGGGGWKNKAILKKLKILPQVTQIIYYT